MNLFVKISLGVLLMLVLLFCAYGFLCTFEPMPRLWQMAWRIIYLGAGLATLRGFYLVWKAGNTRQSPPPG